MTQSRKLYLFHVTAPGPTRLGSGTNGTRLWFLREQFLPNPVASILSIPRYPLLYQSFMRA